jgi:signal transduction histidine kinase
MRHRLASRIGLGVLLAGMLSIATLVSGLFYMASHQDKQALAAERQMVAGGMLALADTLIKLDQDYAWWTDLYVAAEKNDLEWLKPNAATTVTENETVDLIVLFDANTVPLQAWDTGTGENPDTSFLEAEFLQMIRDDLAAQPMTKIPVRLTYARIHGKPALVAYTRVYTTEETPVAEGTPLPSFMMGFYLTEERIAAIGATYLIGDLRIAETPSENAIPLRNRLGGMIGNLTWTASRPGTTILKKAMVPLAVITLLLLSIVAIAGSAARRQAAGIIAAEADAKRAAERAEQELVKKAKLAQLGELTATIAHEIRNPMATVRTSAFLLGRKLANKGLGVEAPIERIEYGIRRCDKIIAQLIDYARSRDLECGDVTIDEWLARVIEEEAAQLPGSVKIECILGLGAMAAAIDAPRMQRVIGNLLLNASEAMVGKEKEGVIHDTTANPLIKIESRRTARGIEIMIIDNGPGITPENLEKIFEPLFTTKNFGTGLGLPASANILERHGGGLDVASTPGKGTTFTMWIPASTTAQTIGRAA